MRPTTPFVLSIALSIPLMACGDDDTESNGSGGSTTTSTTSGTGGTVSTGGSTATGGAGNGGAGTGGAATGGAGTGGNGTCTPFGEVCVEGVDTCCDAAGEIGECFAFGQGPKCTIPCPPDPADCPNNGAGCNNQDPPRCKAP